jgi:hypothetical protein
MCRWQIRTEASIAEGAQRVFGDCIENDLMEVLLATRASVSKFNVLNCRSRARIPGSADRALF